MTESNPSISLTVTGAIARIVLNRPERYNAINEPMMQRLRAALDEARDPAVRCVVLSARGKGFCAGQDLNVLAQQYEHQPSANPTDLLRETYNPVIAAIRDLPKPVIAAVQGVAAGAGWALVLACDLRIAARSARFVPAFPALGLAPDMGGASALVESVGYARALEFLLLSEGLTAEQAQAIGLLNAVVEDSALPATTDVWAERIVSLAPAGVAQTKRLLRDAARHANDRSLADEAWAQAMAASDPDHRALIAAWRSARR
jgi:2-(1,2-epoxy-1,2-dihydrophenyl)acetyl-CoA isomerase